MLVLHHHLHKAANLLTLLAQIGIQQGFIAFAAAPKHVVFTAQTLGGVHGGEHLGSRPTEDFRIRVGGRTGTVTRMGKAVGGAPQQFYPAAVLFFFQHVGHDRKVVQVLFQRSAFRRDVDVMEAVIGNVQLVEKLERHVGLTFG
ncbi:hypothetical protein D3C78_1307140 [compost metagenome]